jgi:hypothetical protein
VVKAARWLGVLAAIAVCAAALFHQYNKKWLFETLFSNPAADFSEAAYVGGMMEHHLRFKSDREPNLNPRWVLVSTQTGGYPGDFLKFFPKDPALNETDSFSAVHFQSKKEGNMFEGEILTNRSKSVHFVKYTYGW